MNRFFMIVTLAVLVGWLHLPQALARDEPESDYLVYVLSESADKISVIRFGPKGAKVDREIVTGIMEPDIDGPHGIVVSPDRQYYYVSLAHGRPFGTVWKYATRDNRVIGKTTLGFFPATMDISPDGNFLYVVNFNLHGDMVPSSVSIVLTDPMLEIKRVTTCTMPHGSRINPQGTKQYSACMMDDMLVEIDMETFKVSRHFRVSDGREQGGEGSPTRPEHMTHESSGSQMMDHVTCSPTWAQPSADGSRVYVACNKSSEIVEIDVKSWKLLRRFPAGEGVYNLAVTRNGKQLIATNKRGRSVSIYDTASAMQLSRLPTIRKVVHGVVVSPDDRYAFVSVEGIGTEPGTVEIIDLVSFRTVATVDVPPQAAGIAFWKMENIRE